MFHFYIESPNIADWLSLLFAIMGVTIAFLGLRLAINTLGEWKKQKKWDIILESKALTTSIYSTFILNKLRFINDIHEFKNKEENSVRQALKFFHFLNKQTFFPFELEIEINKFNDIVRTTLNYKTDLEAYLIDFYNTAFSILLEFNEEKFKAYSELHRLANLELSSNFETSEEIRIEFKKSLNKIEIDLVECMKRRSKELESAYFLIIQNDRKYANIKL